MFLKQCRNLLPKKLLDGVALKTAVSQHQLFKVRGLKKLSKIKLPLGVFLLLYLLGYQPTLALPPIKQAVVKAEFSQEQSVGAAKLSEAFKLPHPGYLTTRFSSWHPGVDIATGLGMPIHPIGQGKVVEVTYGFWGLGYFVRVEHEQGFKSTYAHMGRIFVKAGDTVTSSSTLGEVGLTGHTSGPHTHLEITKDGQYINPQNILPEIPLYPTSANLGQ
jgi:murein DD-endopeptidase MepM/ murein hydrolase activator NlpD